MFAEQLLFCIANHPAHCRTALGPVYIATDQAVQARIVGLEMVLKPVGQALAEFMLVDFHRGLEVVGELANIVEQPLVVGLVLAEGIVTVALHGLFLEREVRGDTAVDIAEPVEHPLALGAAGDQFEQRIDLANQLLVLVIDPVDAGAIFIAPFDRCHECREFLASVTTPS